MKTNPEENPDQLELPVFDDDITEADNPIPRWWIMLDVFCIAIAIGYFAYYHMMALGPSLQEQLRIDVAEAKRTQEIRDRILMAKLEAIATPAQIGAKYFKTFCVSCHGTEGEGNIGPNLHDNFWIHEPTVSGMTNVITHGVANKGMPAWGNILGERKVKGLVAYVMTLKDEPLTIAGKSAEGKVYSKEELATLMSATKK